MVRSGETVEDIDALRRAGLVGVRFEAVGDVRGLSIHEIEQAIAATKPEELSSQLRSRLLRFANDVKVGDLIIVPNLADRELWAVMVTSPYEHQSDPAVPRYHHVHEATWLGWIERDASWLRHKLQYLETSAVIVELRDPDWWFSQIALLDLPPDRLHRPRRAPVPVAAGRGERGERGRSATPRAPRAPRPPAAPKPAPASKEPERALCAGQCGLQWRTNVLVDGMCPDCRGD